MNATRSLSLVLAGLVLGLAPLTPGDARAQDPPKPQVKIPDAGVPEVMTMEGKFVRAAYNNEGYVIIGYQPANRSIGEEWLLIDVGITVRDGVKDYELKREALSLETPDGKTHPLPSIEEFRKGDTQALQNREKVQRDSINYFPPSASRACAMTFFPNLTSRAMPQDDVELSQTRACLGRLFFHVPGGIQYGQHWLNVKFEKDLIRVPFRILTKDEEKFFSKNYKDISKQVKDAFKPKKK
jgi:hypothetical protein